MGVALHLRVDLAPGGHVGLEWPFSDALVMAPLVFKTWARSVSSRCCRSTSLDRDVRAERSANASARRSRSVVEAPPGSAVHSAVVRFPGRQFGTESP